MEKYAIAVDWLQVYCIRKSEESFAGMTFSEDGREYTVVDGGGGTALFNQRCLIKLRGLVVADICWEPRCSTINPRAAIIKLANRLLYCNKYIKVLYEIIRGLNVAYKGITRIDLSYDCIRFKHGRKPQKFIADFARLNIASNKSTLARKGGRKCCVVFEKQDNGQNEYSYIRFGQPSSKVHSYMYDKTKELEEVKDKPWIREYWKENGIVPQEGEHVWRSEISIKAQGMDILNMATGELFRLSPEYLENQRSIEKLFYYYAAKYFAFVHGAQENKRNKKKVELFECTEEITCKPIFLSRFADSGKFEKACYNKLDKLSSMYSDMAGYYRESLRNAMDFLLELSNLKKLKSEHIKRADYIKNFKSNRFLYEEYKMLWNAANIESQAKKESVDECLRNQAYLDIVDILANDERYRSIDPHDIYEYFYNNKERIASDLFRTVSPRAEWPRNTVVI